MGPGETDIFYDPIFLPIPIYHHQHICHRYQYRYFQFGRYNSWNFGRCMPILWVISMALADIRQMQILPISRVADTDILFAEANIFGTILGGLAGRWMPDISKLRLTQPSLVKLGLGLSLEKYEANL
jgi:hypothetical protein